MKKLLVIAAVIISLLGCKQEEKEKERTLSDFFDEQEEIVLKSQTSNNKTRLLLDYFVDMTRKQFDSVTKISISKNLVRIKNDTVYNLIVPNVEDHNSIDYFDLVPVFRNDSLKAIHSYITLGYYSYGSENTHFKEYSSMLTTKYGGGKSIYISDHKPYESVNNEIHMRSEDRFQFWIKDNLFVQLDEQSFPDNEKEKEIRYLGIYYLSLDFKKDIIIEERKEEELKLEKERGEKKRKELLRTTNDSVRSEIF